jgi:cell division protein FtsB
LRWLLLVLLLILAMLQYRLWFAAGSLAEQHRLELQVEEQSDLNRALRARNAVVEREVLELQNGTEGIEQRAREELGLIREGEVFYQFVDRADAGNLSPNTPHASEAKKP